MDGITDYRQLKKELMNWKRGQKEISIRGCREGNTWKIPKTQRIDQESKTDMQQVSEMERTNVSYNW